MSRCWAQAISNCSDDLSREHYFTYGAWLTDELDIRLPSFSAEETRRISLKNAVVKSLCVRHNNALSDLDQAFIDFVNAIREVERIRKIRASSHLKRHTACRFVVDGPKIERWMLKTVLNTSMVMGRDLQWNAPDVIARVVFGKETLGEGVGLGALARVGDQSNYEVEAIGISFEKPGSEREPRAVLFELRRGLHFVCTWQMKLADLPTMQLAGRAYYPDKDLIWHVRRINYADGPQDLALSLDFDWSGKWTEKQQPSVVRLRDKYKAPAR